MQTQRLWRGLAVLALGLVLIWGIQATFAAPGDDDGPNVEQANDHKPDHEQGGNGNGGGRPDDAGPPEDPGNGNGNGNGNTDPGPPDNPGNGNGSGNADPGPPDNPGNGNGNAAPPAQDEVDGEDDDQQAQGPSDKVLVCHVTSSDSNPSELIEVSENAVPAHEAHGDTAGDEAAEACEEDGGAAPPDGTPDGSPIASPVAPGHKVLVCHATSSDDNPFVLIEIDEHAVPAHEAHGDIVDVESAEDCTAGTPVASPVASPVAEDD